jgi:hypothetical protein
MAGRVNEAPPPPRPTDGQPTADERVVTAREARPAETDGTAEAARAAASAEAATTEAAREFGIGGVVNAAA